MLFYSLTEYTPLTYSSPEYAQDGVVDIGNQTKEQFPVTSSITNPSQPRNVLQKLENKFLSIYRYLRTIRLNYKNAAF